MARDSSTPRMVNRLLSFQHRWPKIEFGQIAGSYFHPHFQDVVFFSPTVTVLTSTSSLAALFDQVMTTKLLNLTFQADIFIFNTHDQPTLEIHLLLQIIVQPE